ncbi:hypothetical protein QE152_g21749 [Popillia japonica]|uniref:Reverse transcriptase domain-containing protein n=1 Tax=Popillia japonica TaxID=7064 RepID=A0AAW1KMJ6_POPJA
MRLLWCLDAPWNASATFRTPAHFLVGKPLVAIPDVDLKEVPTGGLAFPTDRAMFATFLETMAIRVLPYGLSNLQDLFQEAQDLFQEAVARFFGNIENVEICHDDMIIAGATKEEHDVAVEKVMEKARQVNAKFNNDKFQYYHSRVKFMGQIISQEEAPALTPFDPKKKTILQCDASKNGLGCCLTPFDPKKKTILQCDASKNGLGCCLFQEYEEVDVQSDHKPIISIMKKAICKIGSVRLQRLRIKLLKYSLNVYYVPGKDIHFEDMLSRANIKSEKPKVDFEMIEMVHSVSKHLPFSNKKNLSVTKRKLNLEKKLLETKFKQKLLNTITKVGRKKTKYYQNVNHIVTNGAI